MFQVLCPGAKSRCYVYTGGDKVVSMLASGIDHTSPIAILQESGGCLVFCTTRKQCETQAAAFSELLASEGVTGGCLDVRPAGSQTWSSIEGSQADMRDGRQRLVLELMAAQGGEMVEPLLGILATGAGVAYHHAGRP
jgi:hypothetical protein